MTRATSTAELVELVLAIPRGQRAGLVMEALSFRPSRHLEQSFRVGPLRAALSNFWEARMFSPIPTRDLKSVLQAPVRIGTVLEFTKLDYLEWPREAESQLSQLIHHLRGRVWGLLGEQQRSFLEADVSQPPVRRKEPGTSVSNLTSLIEAGAKFLTIYADPPWPYENQASRAAAVNHYPTLSLKEIEAEPVRELSERNAHLHLWTTNGFLREAFAVMEAWGFEFKSTLVWVKADLGMGNYWRVSHEFLLLGVRGSLTFRDRTLPSWIHADRTIHSRKPGVVRLLVERVSPGPYLELYGREELPNSEWTVYGNEVEKRFC